MSGLRTYDGAVAIVTGGASGIGLALGKALARHDAEVVLADRQCGPAEAAAAGLRADGGRARAAELDVRDYAAFESLVRRTHARCGRLDFLFNNAGIGIGGEVRVHRIEHWNRQFDVNIRGVSNGVQAAYSLLLDQGFGHIVNTASMAGLMPCPGTTAYSASKHAVVGLSTYLRVEAALGGVRISALCPGVVRTPILENAGEYGEMIQPMSEEIQERLWRRLRPMDPDRFALRVLRAVARNRAIIVVPGWWPVLWWLNRLSPALGLRLARRLYEPVQAAVLTEQQARAGGDGP